MMLITLHIPVCHLYVFFEEMSIRVLLNFLSYLGFFYYWILRFLYIFWIVTLCQIGSLKIFFPFHRLPFWWLFPLLCKFTVFPLVCFYLFCLCYSKNHCQDSYQSSFFNVFLWQFYGIGLKFKSLINFYFNFTDGVWHGSNFFLSLFLSFFFCMWILNFSCTIY